MLTECFVPTDALSLSYLVSAGSKCTMKSLLEDMETLTKADDDHGKFAVMMIGESSSWNRCYMERNERRGLGTFDGTSAHSSTM